MAFTEKGLAAIKIIKEKYVAGDPFTAADLGVAPAVLTSLAKDGYLIRQDTKPVSYVCNDNCREKIDKDYPKSFAPYSVEEMATQVKMTYQELIDYCINKYGRVSGNYFCTPEMKSANHKIKRGNEGLYVHHIMEDRAIMLGNSLFAIEQPWEYQMPHNLVYCNIFEHLLLHARIVFEYDETKSQDSKILPGIGGIINYIHPQIFEQYLKEKGHNTIENITFDQYTKIFNPLMEKIKLTSLYKKLQTQKLAQQIMMSSLLTQNTINNSTSVSLKSKQIKRSDGYVYKSLEEAARSIGGGKGKIRKIEKAANEHTKYGGFYWAWIK